MRIGLLFGSFNPIHNGHLAIAKKCIEEKLVDLVQFVVAYQNPFKDEYTVSFSQRVEMIEDIIKYKDVFSVNTIENELVKKGKSNKTYNVLKSIKNNDDEFIIICGDDIYTELKKWYRGQDILNENKFIVFSRNSKNINNNSNILSYIDISGFEDISSSKIRENVKRGKDISKYVPYQVDIFIHLNNLYQK